jgi:hypothetical protein
MDRLVGSPAPASSGETPETGPAKTVAGAYAMRIHYRQAEQADKPGQCRSHLPKSPSVIPYWSASSDLDSDPCEVRRMGSHLLASS